LFGFKHLQAFVAIVEEKSFTKAAGILFQTQPALSMQIKNLENALGFKLIERKDKDILLTDAGKIFYPEAKKILDSMIQTREALAELKNLGRGNLSIGASTLPGEYIVPSIIASYQKLYPAIKVKMKIGDTGQIINALKSREVQVGFIGAWTSDPLTDIKKIREDEMCLITGPDWPDDYDWDMFPFEQLILREKGSGTRQVVEEYLVLKYKVKEALKPKMEVGSTRAIINMVAAGLGVSFVSGWSVEESLKLGKIKVVSGKDIGFTRTIYGAILKGSYLSHAARAFWDLAT